MTTTSLLFQSDSYLKAFEAKVLSVRSDGGLILDQTCFYYNSGGQPSDRGKLVRVSDGVQAEVKEVRKIDGEVVHVPSAPSHFQAGDTLHGEIDWPRRHQLMRMHTAGHILSAVFFKRGVLITGNQLDTDQSRFDFSLEEFDRSLIDSIIAEANAERAKNLPVRVYSLPREEAIKLPGMVKLAAREPPGGARGTGAPGAPVGVLPPSLTTLRIVEIVGLDVQADGGTHVKNTSEVGKIELVKLENKGAKNRRIYFTLKP